MNTEQNDFETEFKKDRKRLETAKHQMAEQGKHLVTEDTGTMQLGM